MQKPPAKSPARKLKELAAVAEKHEVTHLEIYDRLKEVEKKVDKIETNTEGMVAAFQAAQGAFTVLDWLAKIAKPLLLIAAFATAVATAWSHIKIK